MNPLTPEDLFDQLDPDDPIEDSMEWANASLDGKGVVQIALPGPEGEALLYVDLGDEEAGTICYTDSRGLFLASVQEVLEEAELADWESLEGEGTEDDCWLEDDEDD